MSKESRQAVRAVFLAAIMVISVFAAGIAFSGSAAANHGDNSVIVVDGDFTTTNETHKNSLADAVSAASSGDTIRVRSGTYTNSQGLTVDVSNVEITAAENANPTLSVEPDSVSGTAAIDITADGVTISGLTIERISAASTNRTLSAGHAQGISVQASDVVIENNELIGSLNADNGAPDVFDGIVVFDPYNGGDGGTTENVSVINNDVSGFDTGYVTTVFYSSSSVVRDVSFENNNATNNRIGFAAKTHKGSISGVSGSGNDFTGNDQESIVFSPESYQGYSGLESIPTTAVNFDGPVLVEDGDSIQTAVDVAAEDATIEVGPGTYGESVTVGTKNVIVEGPNAGITGESDERGDEATITDELTIKASNVTVDGFNFEFNGTPALHSKSGSDNLITNSRFKQTGDAGTNYAVRVGGGSPGTDVTNNLFTGIVNGSNADGVVVTDPRDTTIASNTFDTVDTGVNIGDKTPEAGTLVVKNNDFSDIRQYGAVLINNDDPSLDIEVANNNISSSDIGVLVFNADSEITTNIENNRFEDNPVHVQDDAGVIDLNIVFDSNNFSPVVAVAGSSGDLVTGSIYGDIQPAVTAASSGDTVVASPGTYNESVEISTQNVTLIGPNAGTPGDASRGDEAIIEQGLKINASDVTVDGLQIENDDTNGLRIGPEVVVDNVTIVNNRITNVEGGSFIRKGADAGAGNGIQIQFGNGDPYGETAQNVRIINNEISNISTRDVGEVEGESGRTLAIGINVIPRGNDIDGLVIYGNTIRDIEPGVPADDAEAEARAITVDTQLDDPDRSSASLDAAGQVSGLSITNNTVTELTAADTVAAITLYEDWRVDPRIGVENFSITRNEFSQFDSGDEVAIFIGGYETLGEDHTVSLNNFRDGDIVRYDGKQSGYTISQADRLSATLNFYDGRLANDSVTITGVGTDSRGSDAVIYDPVLTAPPAEVADDWEDIRNYGSYIELETTGKPAVIGFPAPPAEPLGELLPDDLVERQDGEAVNVFVYDNAEQSFDLVNGSYTPEAGEVLIITSESSVSSEFVVPVDTAPDGIAGVPSQVEIYEGWNLIAPGATNSLEEPISTTEILQGGRFQVQPRTPGAPSAVVGPYEGVWFFAEDDGQLATGYVEDQPPISYFELVLDPEAENDSEDS